MQRQRALLGQMHTVCSECEGHCWRGPGTPEIRAQQALPGAKQCSGPQTEEGTRWPTAPGVLCSCLGSAMLSRTACYDFTQKSSTGRFWLHTSCLSKRACWHQESGGFSTAQKAATAWVLSSFGLFMLGTARCPFNCRKHTRADTVSQNSHKWQVAHLQYI